MVRATKSTASEHTSERALVNKIDELVSTLAGKTEPNTGRIQPTETRDSATANRTFLAKIEALNEKLESQKTPAKPVVTPPEISVLAKLDALIDGITEKPEEQQAQSLLSKFEELLEKATKRIGDGPLREGNTATLAAFSEANKTETSELMKKIRHMENTFTDILENLYRRVDNRINGLAQRNQTGREEQIDYREYNQRRAKPGLCVIDVDALAISSITVTVITSQKTSTTTRQRDTSTTKITIREKISTQNINKAQRICIHWTLSMYIAFKITMTIKPGAQNQLHKHPVNQYALAT